MSGVGATVSKAFMYSSSATKRLGLLELAENSEPAI
jgi:hypothetical protein